MSKVVNLSQKRKQRARDEKRDQANQNAVLHGLSKAQKTVNKTRSDRAARVLDLVKRDV